MPIRPRYRRVSALQRQFFNREELLGTYDDELRRISDRLRILNIVGVGGIGKSRLLQELRTRTPDSCRTARLDLQLPTLRQQEDALAVLRMEFGAQGVQFDRFDIAYAVLWQRVHPQLQMDRKNTPFAEDSEVLSKILDDAMGLPVFGTAAGLVRLTGRAMSNRRRRQRIESDPTLQELDGLSNAELGHAVSYLFAEEMRQSAEEKPYVLFVDAYEAMVPTPLPGGRSYGSDAWLRDLLGQLHGGLTVLASREPLPWSAYDKEWESVIRQTRIDGLPMAARLDLLAQAGITEMPTQRTIAEASAGVPFYLHLAVDTHAQSPAASATDAGTAEEIVQRFLQHVAPDEVRILELLSVARTFDLGMFREIGRSFDLPTNLLTWESLTAYSFAYPLPGGWYRLHQLMIRALQHHLSPSVKRHVHSVVRGYWEGLATRMESGAEGSGVARSSPLREAVHHGLHAEDIAPDRIQEHADRAVSMSGRQAADGMVKDIREFLASPPRTPWAEEALPGIKDAADCLDAESKLELGDASTVIEMTPALDMPVRSVVSARLALAGANARRIAGESSHAARIFARVWTEHDGPARPSAGLCVADIRMWQGDFAGAFALADEVYALCAPHDRAIRGDLKRLMHLGHRFLMDFARAEELLAAAEAEYRAAGAVVGLANVRTNRAELLAFVDPEAAVAEAGAALEVQRDLGAQHEIGKVYTAMAIAQLRLGRLERAEVSFRNANTALDRAGYRSGRARADLFRTFLLLRRGEREAARALLVHATREFETCQVYPSLVLAIGAAAARTGLLTPELEAAVDRARPLLRPLGTLEALERRTDEVLSMLLEEVAP
ncbi:hypothetical protein [Streptomyces sp. NPDC015131]|uniref:hypothetical protein n=1 Tax=Streptomyces sp. NPDC015131 TaxID=3364941 RepID=UPI0036FC0D5B